MFSQKMTLLAHQVRNQIKGPIKYMRPWSFSRMYPRSKKHYLLIPIKPIGAFRWISGSLRIQAALIPHSTLRNGFPNFHDAIPWRNRHHLHLTALNRIVDGLPMKVEIAFWRCCFELLLYPVDLCLRLLVAEGVWKCEKGRLVAPAIMMAAKSVSEFKDELVFLIRKIRYFWLNTFPFLLGMWQHSVDRFQTLPIQLGLLVQILEGECQLLTLGHSVYREVEPCSVAVFGVRRWIIRHPQKELISTRAPRNPRQIPTAKITIKCYSVISHI